MGARVGDGGGGLRGEEHQHLLVVVSELGRALLLGEEEVAHVHAAMTHRGTEEGLRAHEVGGEAERADAGREVGEAHRPRQVAEMREEPRTVGPSCELLLLPGG